MTQSDELAVNQLIGPGTRKDHEKPKGRSHEGAETIVDAVFRGSAADRALPERYQENAGETADHIQHKPQNKPEDGFNHFLPESLSTFLCM